jgi:ABC-2 type transport system permease protein
MRQIRYIAQKELYHILRDYRSLMIIFIMPVMMTFMYGYAVNMDINHIPFSVIDQDDTPESRLLTEHFYRSTYFTEPKQQASVMDPADALRAFHAAGVLVIQPGFAKALQNKAQYQLGLLIDGSDVSQAAAVQAYANALLNQYLMDRLPPGTTIPGIQLAQQVLYNPDLESSHFFVPGIVAIILLMISALLTSITIAREKETGTMEQLLTAPVTPLQILLGKLVPYIVIAFIDGLLVVGFAKLLFNVPFVGSFPLLLGFELIYVMTALSIGILISTMVPTQQLAMQFALLSTMLPTIMLSGFIFAVKNMPLPLQILSRLVPATPFLKSIRGIMLKGSGFSVLAPQALFLLLLMILFLFLAVRRFKARIG